MPDDKRRKLSKREKYAAVILQLKRGDGRPFVDREWAKKKTTEEIITAFEKMVQWDHAVPLRGGGTNHPTNIDPLPPDEHAEKTKVDVSRMAKGRRLSKKHEEHRKRLLTSSKTEPTFSRAKKATMPGSKDSPYKRKLTGKVVRRDRDE